jgi:N,N-dimethylformamidase beta subunit-like, C-terminal
VTLQILRSGPEQGRTRSRDVMRGVAVDRRRWVGTRPAGSRFDVRIGNWPSGLYFARLTAPHDIVAFAPLVLRPRRLGEHRVAVVLPTQTWQAYNFRDDNHDGRADTWYAGNGNTARLGRPFLNRGVPPHFRHYDLPFLHWITRTGKQVDVLSDADLNNVKSGRRLARAYDLLVFSGHHEYVTDQEYAVVRQYRNAGGNLMFLFANDFFWRITIHGDVMTRTARWRDLGRPEAALIGVQYRGNDRGLKKGPWLVRQTAALPWLFAGTGLAPGSHIARGGIEIDHRAAASPPNLQVIAEIPNLFGRGFTAQMTYYRSASGAKVFAAGAFGLVESILEPDKPLPDPEARRTENASRRLLANLWAALSLP